METGVKHRDIVLDIIEKYASGADILDLGCGVGSTGSELADTYHKYVGVDVSEVAIAKAKSAPSSESRRSITHFVVGDVVTFEPETEYSIILFRESLYYCPERNILLLLNRYSSYLTAEGVFIVRLHDRIKYQSIVQLIEGAYTVRERIAPADGPFIILVFAPPEKVAVRE